MPTLLTPDRLIRPGELKPARVPIRISRVGTGLRPRLSPLGATFWRFMLEKPFPRYMAALTPIVLVMLIWPDISLPVSQAPVPMFMLIFVIETRVLSIPTEAGRKRLIDPDAAGRALDLFQQRGTEILTGFAARAGVQDGPLVLVVEQSRMARVPPLTFVSIQQRHGETAVLTPDAVALSALETELFGGDLPEKLLQRVNLSQNIFLRTVELDPATISAHARLDALAVQRAAAAGTGPGSTGSEEGALV